MVAPLIAGGIMAAGAIASYMQSQEARNLSEKERADLKRLLQNMQSPRFDTSEITPEQYKVVGKYVPVAAQYVQEEAPEVVKMASADSGMARDTQREALSRLRALSQGNDPLGDAEQAEALAKAGDANRGRVGAVREDFARRGQGGGTSEMLAQLLGAQQANEIASTGSRQAFMEGERRKLQSLRDSTSLAGAIRDDEFRTERGNSDIINSFNERTSARRQTFNNNAANAANEGQQFNLRNEQDVSNKNVGAGNDSRVSERDRQDRLSQQTYTNEMAKVTGQMPITTMAREDARNSARDTNSAIGGATDAVATGAMYYDSKPKETAAEPTNAAASQSLTAQPSYQEADEDSPLKRRYNLGVRRQP